MHDALLYYNGPIEENDAYLSMRRGGFLMVADRRSSYFTKTILGFSGFTLRKTHPEPLTLSDLYSAENKVVDLFEVGPDFKTTKAYMREFERDFFAKLLSDEEPPSDIEKTAADAAHIAAVHFAGRDLSAFEDERRNIMEFEAAGNFLLYPLVAAFGGGQFGFMTLSPANFDTLAVVRAPEGFSVHLKNGERWSHRLQKIEVRDPENGVMASFDYNRPQLPDMIDEVIQTLTPEISPPLRHIPFFPRGPMDFRKA